MHGEHARLLLTPPSIHGAFSTTRLPPRSDHEPRPIEAIDLLLGREAQQSEAEPTEPRPGNLRRLITGVSNSTNHDPTACGGRDPGCRGFDVAASAVAGSSELSDLIRMQRCRVIPWSVIRARAHPLVTAARCGCIDAGEEY